MSGPRRGLGPLAGAVALAAAVLAVTACGSAPSTPSASPTSTSRSAQLAQVASCLGTHGIKVPSPVTRKALRTALQSAAPATKQAAKACEQYATGLRKKSPAPKKS